MRQNWKVIFLQIQETRSITREYTQLQEDKKNVEYLKDQILPHETDEKKRIERLREYAEFTRSIWDLHKGKKIKSFFNMVISQAWQLYHMNILYCESTSIFSMKKLDFHSAVCFTFPLLVNIVKKCDVHVQSSMLVKLKATHSALHSM